MMLCDALRAAVLATALWVGLWVVCVAASALTGLSAAQAAILVSAVWVLVFTWRLR